MCHLYRRNSLVQRWRISFPILISLCWGQRRRCNVAGSRQPRQGYLLRFCRPRNRSGCSHSRFHFGRRDRNGRRLRRSHRGLKSGAVEYGTIRSRRRRNSRRRRDSYQCFSLPISPAYLRAKPSHVPLLSNSQKQPGEFAPMGCVSIPTGTATGTGSRPPIGSPQQF